MKFLIPLMLVFLQGCMIHTSAAFHEKHKDYYGKGGTLVGSIEAEKQIADSPFSVFIRHDSVIDDTDDDPGLNSAGAKVTFDLR